MSRLRRSDPLHRAWRAAAALALAAAALVAGCGGGDGGGAADAASVDTAAAVTTTASTVAVPIVPSAVASTLGSAGGSLVRTGAGPSCQPVTQGTLPILFAGGLLREVCRDLWLDGGYSSADEAAVIAALDGAARRLVDVFESLANGLPIVILCRTAACVRHYTGSDGRNITLYPGAMAPGGSFAAGLRTVTVVTAPTLQWLEQILAHEFSHHELYGRVAGQLDRIPPWFNEGLATLVGHVPNCSPMPPSPLSPAALADQVQWNFYTAVHPEEAVAVYCAAARELDAWVAAHGRSALMQLIDAVAAGTSFSEVYGPPYLDRAPVQLVDAL